MRRWRTKGSTASTTPTPARRSSSATTTGLPTSPPRSSRAPYTSREFLYLLGGHLWTTTGRDGILTAAYRANVPIFCPAIADSSIGMGLSQARQNEAGRRLHRHHRRHRRVGEPGHPASADRLGGARRRHAEELHQPGERAGRVLQRSQVGGHRYALQIVTDVPHFGGASGSSLEEAQSWGKLATDAAQVTVQADATIALPLLASALAEHRAAAARRAARCRCFTLAVARR